MHFSPKFGEKGIGSTYYYIAKCIAVLVAGEHGRGHAVAGGGHDRRGLVRCGYDEAGEDSCYCIVRFGNI